MTESEHPELTIDELAALSGSSVERIADLTARGIIRAEAPGRYLAGDLHRIRFVDLFESSGVPLDALITAAEHGRVDFAHYDDLHLAPGAPSSRSYRDYRASLGALGDLLPTLFAAFGLAEPGDASHLSAVDEEFIAGTLRTLDATGRPALALRVVRLFAEATRRAAEASLDVYAEAMSQLGIDPAEMVPEDEYERTFRPWWDVARGEPALAAWLTTQHVSRAIDAYSVEATERLLEAGGFIGERPDVEPAIAFVDLTGFTRLTEQHGDEAAAAVALQLGEVAGEVATRHGGRVVKLLGDGVLLRFAGSPSAVEATLDLLAALPARGMPAGHAGVHQGPLIARDGDVFGRTVNLAARIADVAPAGELYVTQAVADSLAGRDGGHGSRTIRLEPGPVADLQGVGPVPLLRVVRDDG